jgi:hypothetical protein
MQTIHDIAAVDEARAHDKPVPRGFRQRGWDCGRRMGPQHVLLVDIMRITRRARDRIWLVEQPVVVVGDRNYRRPADNVGRKPRPPLDGRGQIGHQDVDCVPTLIRVGQITQRQISIETFWT